MDILVKMGSFQIKQIVLNLKSTLDGAFSIKPCQLIHSSKTYSIIPNDKVMVKNTM